MRLPAREPVGRAATELRGEVVHVDRFGNLITNLRAPRPRERRRGDAPRRGPRARRSSRTYGDARPASSSALVGSSGRIEIAVNGGSAAARSRASAGLW